MGSASPERLQPASVLPRDDFRSSNLGSTRSRPTRSAPAEEWPVAATISSHTSSFKNCFYDFFRIVSNSHFSLCNLRWMVYISTGFVSLLTTGIGWDGFQSDRPGKTDKCVSKERNQKIVESKQRLPQSLLYHRNA